MMKKRCTTVHMTFAILTCSGTAAFAAGEFEAGCEFYKLRDYKQAQINFEKAAKDFPNNWVVHYYLANSYLASSQTSSARREYETCMKCNPNAAAAKYCLDALTKLGGSASSSAPITPISSATESSADTKQSEDKPAEASPTVLHDSAMAAERMKKAEAECIKIRTEAKEKLANGATLATHRFITADGVPYIDWNDNERAAITQDAEYRCKQIMDHAIKSTAHIKN